MKLGESVRIARKNMSANKTRSALSMMGLVIGIAAATLVTAISNGMKLAVLESLSAMGTNVLTVYPNDDGSGRSGAIDMDALQRVSRLPFVEAAFPQVSLDADARGDLAGAHVRAVGIIPRYLEVYQASVVEGRSFTEHDLAERAPVCLLNADVARKLYGGASAIGKALRFGGAAYEIVGLVRTAKKPRYLSGPPEDLYIPLTTLMRHEEIPPNIAEVWIRKSYTADPRDAVIDAVAGDPKNRSLFAVLGPEALIAEVENTSKKFRMTMLSLAAISLLVGGIGIMNVMLISVSERTREVGLRKALGASVKDIRMQFVIEVSVLSVVGGSGGVALGIGAAWLAPQFSSDMPTAIMPSAVAVSLAVSVLVGVAFGLYPAFKASRLSPLEALRYE